MHKGANMLSKLSKFSNLPSISWRRALYESFLVILGSAIYAIGVDAFEIPNGLAAGGVTGVATIFAALASDMGITLPVGMQTILMNVLLLAYVVITTHDWTYVARSIFGILISGFLTDLFVPFIPEALTQELLLAAIWGGVLVGVGVGLVFRAGYNTGGTDIICQLIAKRTGIALGTLTIIVDGVIVCASVPVFSLRNALYAAVAMYITGIVIDAVVDGPRTSRIAYIISAEHARIANEILYTLGRGCTELQARGVWSGNAKPMLMCVLGRSETVQLKEIVSEIDPEAIVIVSEVHEAFGEGFGRISAS